MNTKLNKFFVFIIVCSAYAIDAKVFTDINEVENKYLERINQGSTCDNSGCFVPQHNILCFTTTIKKLKICHKVMQALEIKEMVVDEDAIDMNEVPQSVLRCFHIKVKKPDEDTVQVREFALMCPVLLVDNKIGQYFVSLDSRLFCFGGYNLFGYVPVDLPGLNGTLKVDTYITNIKL